MKAWRVNAVRVSLNDACWLGRNGVRAEYGGTSYQNAICDYVDRIIAKGMYPIIDLHFSNPGNAKLHRGQVPMAARDKADEFWTGVANRFTDRPAVLFDDLQGERPFFDWADEHGVSYLSWAWFTGNCAGEPALISDYNGTPTQYVLGLKNHLARPAPPAP